MGALHEGHISLVRAARERAEVVAASIFVNPLQFGAAEDLGQYPRTEEADLAALQATGCDLAWVPSVEVMYPQGGATAVEVAGPAEHWEGAERPGHFRGVATVCTKLFLQTGADIAVFGEKDWQQIQVVRRVVRDLDIPADIVASPTVREPDGLAMSSRNRFLSPQERATAPHLFALLHEAGEALTRGRPMAEVLAAARTALEAAGFRVDYLALVEPETMRQAAALPARLMPPRGWGVCGCWIIWGCRPPRDCRAHGYQARSPDGVGSCLSGLEKSD